MEKLTKTHIIAAVIAVAVIILFFVFLNPGVRSDLVGEETGDALQDIVLRGILESGERNELVVEDIAVGNGARAEAGVLVSVHYTGFLTDGTVFDTSLERGVPFEFVLGSGQVIAGWEEGIEGMRVGGRRILVIPSDLAYGPSGRGPIPPNATLIFDVTLLDILSEEIEVLTEIVL